MKLLVALDKYLINIKIVDFSLFTSNDTVCFPKMKYILIKKLFYGGDEHLWVHLFGNLIKIKMKTMKKTKIVLKYRCDLIIPISCYNTMKCVFGVAFNTPFMGKNVLLITLI